MAPNLLVEDELDPLNDQVDVELTEAEEAEASRRFAPTGDPGDLSDGGMVNGARLTPMVNGRRVSKGRPSARRAWAWDGSERYLPLAWNAEGTIHNGAREYLMARHCLCCGFGGFIGSRCTACVKNGCQICRASTDHSKTQTAMNGKTIKGFIIPAFYLRMEDVPFPRNFYGDVDCFLEACIRRGPRGFLTDQDMRMHARTKHRMEYQSHLEAVQQGRADEMDSLRRRLDSLQASAPVATAERSEPRGNINRENALKGWERRRRRAAATSK